MATQADGDGERDLDAAFDDIVSRWNEESVEPQRPSGPTAPPWSMPPVSGVRIASGQVVPEVPEEGAPQQHFGHRAYTVPDEPEEDFVPRAPAPMPDAESDPTFWAIVCLLAGGPLVLVVLAITGRTSMTWLLGTAVLATIVGFVLLVLRGGRTPRDPGDDGARV